MHSYIHNIVTISHHVTMVQLFASEHAATINLTCLAQFLHSCSLRHIPAASASPGSRLLPFRSNHRSLFNFQKLSGSVVSLFLKRSSLCSWESSPNPSGSSLSEFLLRSSSIRCFRVQNESLEEKGERKQSFVSFWMTWLHVKSVQSRLILVVWTLAVWTKCFDFSSFEDANNQTRPFLVTQASLQGFDSDSPSPVWSLRMRLAALCERTTLTGSVTSWFCDRSSFVPRGTCACMWKESDFKKVYAMM